MPYKSQRVQCPHPNKNDPDKSFWCHVGTFITDEETHAWLTEHEKRITFAPSFVPGAMYSATFKEWEDKKDDPGDGKGGRW
jgi:hypothetical protein